MYRYKLNILIYSRNEFLKEILPSIPPLERFEHHFNYCFSHSENVRNSYEQPDIIIIDVPFSEISVDFNRHCKRQNVRKIFVQTEENRNDINMQMIEEMDEMWFVPNDSWAEKLLCFYFTKLLKLIKLEADLKLKQNYLDTAIDSIPDLVWFKDAQGVHLEVNNSFCEAVGKSKEDCYGRGHYYIWDLKQEEYENGEYVCLETEEIVLREKKTCLFDEHVKSRKGLRQFKTYKSPIFDNNGEVMGTVGIAHDVTDLGNLSEEFKIILESINFAGIIIDKQGEVMQVNSKFMECFQDELQFNVDSNYFTWKEKFLKPKSELNEEMYYEIDVMIGGELIFFEVHEEIIYDVFREKVGYFCLYRDVTEHKKHLDLLENYQKRLEEEVQHKVKELHEIQQQMIISFADIIASRDSVTGQHIKRTSRFVDIIVNSLMENSSYQEYMTVSFVEHMSLAAPLHDIGKISISDEILNKPGKFLPGEFALMKEHAALGGQILDKTLSCLKDEIYYKLARNMAVGHHERWDGTGYPNAQKGTQIPLAARIMAVADVFDALISKRPYKEPFTLEEAYNIIREGSGTQFDPVIVEAFIRCWDKIEKAV